MVEIVRVTNLRLVGCLPLSCRIIHLRQLLRLVENAHLAIQDDAECDCTWAVAKARKLLPFVELGIVNFCFQDWLHSGVPTSCYDNLALMRHTCEAQPWGEHWRDGAPFPGDGIEHPAIEGGLQRLRVASHRVHAVACPADHVELAVASDCTVASEVGNWRREDGEEGPFVGDRVVGLPNFLRGVAAHVEPLFLRAKLFAEAEKIRGSEGGVPGLANQLQRLVLREREPS